MGGGRKKQLVTLYPLPEERGDSKWNPAIKPQGLSPRDPLFPLKCQLLESLHTMRTAPPTGEPVFRWATLGGLSLSVGDSGGVSPSVGDSVGGGRLSLSLHTPLSFRSFVPAHLEAHSTLRFAGTRRWLAQPACLAAVQCTWHLTGNPFQAASPESVPCGGHGSICNREVAQ